MKMLGDRKEGERTSEPQRGSTAGKPPATGAVAKQETEITDSDIPF
jgi:hypothetical protein